MTDTIPKCLVPIHGKPLLTYWIETCETLEVTEVLINTHHLAGQVREWAKSQVSPVKIHLTYEETLLGSAGTLRANQGFVSGDETFYIFYADNLAQINFVPLENTHRAHSAPVTLGLFRTARPEQCGIAELAESGRVISFEEKPKRPSGNLAFAGVAVARRELFDHLPESGSADLGKDVLPKLVGNMYGCELEGRLLDIGTPENYRQAQEDVTWVVTGFGRTDKLAASSRGST